MQKFSLFEHRRDSEKNQLKPRRKDDAVRTSSDSIALALKIVPWLLEGNVFIETRRTHGAFFMASHDTKSPKYFSAETESEPKR